MKKELFAALLLLALLALALYTARSLAVLTEEVGALADKAAALAADSAWDGALAAAGEAVDRWNAGGRLTHTVMHHGEVDAMTADLYALLGAVRAEDAGGVLTAAELVADRLAGIRAVESVRIGSVL